MGSSGENGLTSVTAMADQGSVDKAQLLEALRAQVASDLCTMTAAQSQTLAGATHEEARPENDKDTRALELSYLARGQAQRVTELQESLVLLGQLNIRHFGPDVAIALTALVTVIDGDHIVRYFLAPAGGGRKVRVGPTEVQVITLQSPLGRALLGKRQGDEFELKTSQGVKEITISEVV